MILAPTGILHHSSEAALNLARVPLRACLVSNRVGSWRCKICGYLLTTSMLIGYARISTQDQTLAPQRDALEKVGCEKIFTDRVLKYQRGAQRAYRGPQPPERGRHPCCMEVG